MKEIEDILSKCLKNDRQAQFKLYKYCFDAMMSICMRYERDEDRAMEVLNQAFIKLLKNLRSYNHSKEFLPWVRKITVNTAIDYYRKKNYRRSFVDNNLDDLEDMVSASEAPALAWVEKEYLEHLLCALREVERTVFNLFVLDGYSHKEIAANLEITERSSIRHLTNARRKLQHQLSISEPGRKKA